MDVSESGLLIAYQVFNKTFSLVFESKEDALRYMSTHDVATGFQLVELQIVPKSKAGA